MKRLLFHLIAFFAIIVVTMVFIYAVLLLYLGLAFFALWSPPQMTIVFTWVLFRGCLLCGVFVATLSYMTRECREYIDEILEDDE